MRWLPAERPLARRVREARVQLGSTGPVTLVVDVLEALDLSDPDESPDAVLQDLVEDGRAERVRVQAQGATST